MSINPVETLTQRITYFDLDPSRKLKLSGWFRLFQEAAIQHAEKHRIGAVDNQENNTTWVLNRIKCKFYDYPEYQDEVLVKTWSTGVKKFKGYREFSVFKDGQMIAEASSLWLHVDIEKKTFSKVPQEILDHFPIVADPPVFKDVEKTKVSFNGSADETIVTKDLRYDDIDSNQHVNNTVYLGLVQSALQESSMRVHPVEIFMHFQTEINPQATKVDVALGCTHEPESGDQSFLIKTCEATHASGYVRF